MGTARTMKRQEQRQQERSSIVYKYTPQQLQAEINRQIDKVNSEIRRESAEIRKEAAREVVDMMLAIFALAMHDEMGFGYKRAGRVLEKVKSMFDAMKTQHLSLQDVLTELERIKIKF